MFAHQSNAFILNHEVTDEDVPKIFLGDYSEYDWADDIDDSRVPKPSEPRHSGLQYIIYGSGANAEDIPLFLPSSFGWDWCVGHGHKSLANKEATLCYAQATNAIHRIRLALGFKSALVQNHVRHAHMQKTKS